MLNKNIYKKLFYNSGISKIFQSSLIKTIYNKSNGYGVLHINYNLIDDNQKRILLIYDNLSLRIDVRNGVTHCNVLHITQMIHVLVTFGYSIDVCFCLDNNVISMLKDSNYDYCIGFGPVYKKILQYNNIKKAILLVTENNPDIVQKKYMERIVYFKQRYKNISISNAAIRNDYYDIEQFQISKDAIVMSSQYNIASMKTYFERLYQIDVNGLKNVNYKYTAKHIPTKRNNYVWFGSRGIIHKGLDIIIDAFKQMPECFLNIYGVCDREKKLVQHLISGNKNINLHERINVLSDSFINNVILENVFVISDSCSEGMQSGIATCMLHGVIPIVTKETGYDSNSAIIELPDYKIENIIDTIKKIQTYSDDQIINLSKQAYEYANKKFTLEAFTLNFSNIMKNIIANESQSQ